MIAHPNVYGAGDGLDRIDNNYNGGHIVTQWTIGLSQSLHGYSATSSHIALTDKF